jgi:hypothetical protein
MDIESHVYVSYVWRVEQSGMNWKFGIYENIDECKIQKS